MQQKNALDPETLIKILKGACIAGGAVFFTYLLTALTKLNYGTATPVIVGVLSVLINAIKEYKKGE